MKLTEHFSLAELTFSATAQRKQIDNTPPVAIVQNLHLLAAGLEDVRAALGGLPLRINSGYRCPALRMTAKDVTSDLRPNLKIFLHGGHSSSSEKADV